MGDMTCVALARKKATALALDPEMDALLSRAAAERGVSRAEFVRQQLALVLAELDCFLRRERTAMRAFTSELSRGAFTCAAPTVDLLGRAMEIDRRFEDPGLGLVDASIVARAEPLGVCRLASRDVRHFSAVRRGGGRSFELVVLPRRPERSGARATPRRSSRLFFAADSC